MPTEQEIAEATENWDSMPGIEKEKFVKDVINDTLGSYGYDPVNDMKIDKDLWLEGYGGVYNPKNGTVTFDEDHLYGDDFYAVMKTAFHEAGHAMEEYLLETGEIYKDEYEDYADIFAEFEAFKQLNLSSLIFEPDEIHVDLAKDKMGGSFLDDILGAAGDSWEWFFGSD